MTQAVDTGSSGRSRALDAFRGVAIIQVLIWHTFLPLIVTRVPLLDGAMSITWSGVDLFFVLSGYLIGSILMKNRESKGYFRTFYARRILRIAPLYILLLVIYYGFADAKEPFWPMATLLQNFTWGFGERWGQHFVGVTWSLALEEQFYLLLPLIVWLLPRRFLGWALLGLVCVAPVFRILMLRNGYHMPTYMLLPARMDALLLGALAGFCLRDERLRGLFMRYRAYAMIAWLALAAVFCALALSKLSPVGREMATYGYTIIALFYVMTLVMCLTSKRSFPVLLTPLAWAGMGAYSLYLFHLPIIANLPSWYSFRSALELTSAQIAILSAVAVACWYLIERPSILYGHQKFLYDRDRRAAAAHTSPAGTNNVLGGATPASEGA